MVLSKLFALSLVVAAAFAEGTPSDVIELTADNVAEQTKEGFWLVEFFAPWCGHCKKLAPTWEHLATQLKGKANIAKMDCTQHRDKCTEFGVRGFPTVKLLQHGEDVDKYSGARTATGFASYLKSKGALAEDVVVQDLAQEEPKAPPKAAEEPAAPPAGPSDVIDLTAENFAEKIAEGHWLVKFYAPWCGHCKRLAPTWEHLATQLKGKANIAKVDCTQQGGLCGTQGIKGYPTLKLFSSGAEAAPYQGARDVASIAKFLKSNGALAEDVVVQDLPNEPKAPPKAAQQPPAEPSGPTAVVDLTADNFEEKTAQGHWFVKFYAPWCGHCKRLAPTWEEIATKINVEGSDVTIAKVDCTQHGGLCGTQGIKGYPTLKLLNGGAEVAPYRGGRDAASLTKFLTDQGLKIGAKSAHDEL